MPGQIRVNAMDLHGSYVCGLCHMPSRAGKTKAAQKARDAELADAEALAA